MTISISHYGTTYSTTFDSDDITVDELVRAWVNLFAAAGYSRESLVDLFKDGDPNAWESAWVAREKYDPRPRDSRYPLGGLRHPRHHGLSRRLEAGQAMKQRRQGLRVKPCKHCATGIHYWFEKCPKRAYGGPAKGRKEYVSKYATTLP